MASSQNDSTVKNMLKNLCQSYGWSYGVLWSFDHPNSILLTMKDAYFEEGMQGLINDLVLQAPILGEGLIGQAAFTKKHIWLSSENNYIGHNSSGSIWDMFQDDLKFARQFSSGIKTIAAIPLEPQGVVQFGSIEKILEKTEFINQTKRVFNDIENGNVLTVCSSSPDGLFASLISSEESCFGNGGGYFSVNQSSLPFPPQSYSFESESEAMNQSIAHFQPNATQWSGTSSLTSFKEPNHDMFDLPAFEMLDEFLQIGDFSLSQWYPQTPVQSNVTLNDHLLSQSTGFVPDEKVNSLTISGIDVDFFGSTGDLGDIIPPVVKETHSGNNSYTSGCIANDSSTLPPKNGLFSNLGIKELFEGISGNSNGASTSCVEDPVSSALKRRKTGNSLWEMSSLQPNVYNKSIGQKSEPILKSEPWMGDAYSINWSSISQAKKQGEPSKPTKKKAKPGTRPRPKDRQMILDRMAELRELIPNGEKMSIDCLLDRTIKHMLFLQSVTKHAERIKQIDEPKNKGVIQNNTYSNDPNNNGVTWACEVGNQTMICPLIVEDLSTPGQMLIEMICEEHGFFLEIVDIIRGFGLTILKGVMESREDKIWARFIVETVAKRHVTRHEIFAALVQLLQTIGSNETNPDKKSMQMGNSVLNDFQHSGIQIPVSLADTGYRMNL